MKADKDLSVFLEKEIDLEQNMSKKTPQTDSRVPGFEVHEDGSNLTLTRKLNDETITVKLNINASVDPEESEMPEDYNPQTEEAPHLGELKSKPDFNVEIRKPNGRTLVLSCSFYRGPPEENENEGETGTPEDLFQIENFYILNQDDVIKENQPRDNVYVGDGEIIDGEMYELLMNYLDERGVTNEFAEHLIEYCTHYEHKQYINLLSNLKSFIEGK
ncbi:complement component 1 Q subcomponent-binding protein-like protein [Dinothrombium tinctorium]|uniref:Complement component 1 Q subcomponent-binding protein-like protein n=1 Tax=Dinothrombium tinctorium TaxID=1965070 RepID=A0A443QFC2_9ACAR|nr:complement component 1 Q subcomponent-binding protein-like protein [Dinothrombium tinctorium]